MRVHAKIMCDLFFDKEKYLLELLRHNLCKSLAALAPKL